MATSIVVNVKDREKEIPIAIDLPSDLISVNVEDKIGVLLTHGAGGDLSSGNLPFYAKIFAEVGFPCCRFTCRGPLAHRVAVATELIREAQTLPSLSEVTQWIVAGHSMGARVAAQLAADLPNIVLACIFFSFPLHPPGEREKLRDDPLTRLTLPLLFIRGTKDPFCDEAPWKEVKRRLECRQLEVHSIDGGGHGLEVSRGGKKEKKEAEEESMLAGISDAVKEFCVQVKLLSNNNLGKQRKKRKKGGC